MANKLPLHRQQMLAAFASLVSGDKKKTKSLLAKAKKSTDQFYKNK